MTRFRQLAKLLWEATLAAIERTHAADFVMGLESHHSKVLGGIGSLFANPLLTLFVVILFFFLVGLVIHLWKARSKEGGWTLPGVHFMFSFDWPPRGSNAKAPSPKAPKAHAKTRDERTKARPERKK